MNGRIYSPKYARFLSADPTVPYPTRWYSYNRYMYVGGNPAGWYDPSGFVDKNANDANANANANVPPQYQDLPTITVTAPPPPPPQSCDQYWSNQAANDAINQSINQSTSNSINPTNSSFSQGGLTQAQVNSMSPVGLLIYFAGTVLENGDGQSLYFGPDSNMSQLFSQGRGAQTFEKYVYEKFGGSLSTGHNVDDFAYKFDTPRFFGTANLAEHVVGSWGGGKARVLTANYLPNYKHYGR